MFYVEIDPFCAEIHSAAELPTIIKMCAAQELPNHFTGFCSVALTSPFVMCT